MKSLLRPLLWRPIAFAFCWVVLIASLDAQQPALLRDLLRQNRYELVVRGGEMSGSAAPFFRKALGDAQLIGIGEDHGTREIPQFVTAVCRMMSPGRLDALAVEAGPVVTARLSQWSTQEHGDRQLEEFERENPGAIAFYDWQQEFEMLSQCQSAAAPEHLHLWGLDQEYLGSPLFLLRQTLVMSQSPAVREAAVELLSRCDAYTKKSVETHDWRDSCMFQLSAAQLVQLQSAAANEPGAPARALIEELIKSQHIYRLHLDGRSYEGNCERATLLKQNFLSNYRQLSETIGRPPRVLLKFGANHLYRGFDTTHLLNLGNFVTEFADGLGVSAVNILVLGLSGEEQQARGPGLPDRPEKTERGRADSFLAPLNTLIKPGMWTVFDMRPLRSRLAEFGHMDRELERMVLGYDIVVLLPHVSPEDPVK